MSNSAADAGSVGGLLSVSQAADRIGRTEAGLRYMIHAGTAPRSARLGGRRMFRTADIDAWIDAAFAGSAA